MESCDNGIRPALNTGGRKSLESSSPSLSANLGVNMYKFNSGKGAVICDICNTMIDSNISLKEYEDIYEGKNGNGGDLCWRCIGNFKIKDSKNSKVNRRNKGNIN